MKKLTWALSGLGGGFSSRPAPVATAPLVLSSGSEALDLGEGRVRIIADSAVTGGAWSALERTEPPGTRTALHRHNKMDEAFYVVSGTFTVYLAGTLHRLSPGGFVYIPRGTPHAQGNSSPSEVTIVSLFSPGGWEQSAHDRAALHAEHPAGTPAFDEKIGSVYAKHDIEVLALADTAALSDQRAQACPQPRHVIPCVLATRANLPPTWCLAWSTAI